MPTFPPIFARDPHNPDQVASNGKINLFDPDDPNKTPIALTKVDGTPLPNPYTVNTQGMGPAFTHPTLFVVAWEGGGFSNVFVAHEEMHAATLAAKEEAEQSRLLAADAQAAATGAAATAGTEAAVAAEAELAARIATGEFKGDKGDTGLPGPDAIPADEAVATYATTPGTATATALSAATASQIDATVPPLVAQSLAADDAPAQAAAAAVSDAVVGLSLVERAADVEPVSDVVGGILDSNNRATWLTHTADGGLTSYALARIQAAVSADNPTSIRHTILENELRMAYGGTVRTNGAAPVCLIFDHGLNKFRDIMLPLLTERGFPSVMALNGNLHKPGYNIEAESNLVQWSEINGWTSVEIANHGARHSTLQYTLAEMEAEIVGSLNDLKTNLPAKKILNWVQPAALYPENFNDGRTTDNYAETVTGRMIHGHHAVATGMWQTPTHPLIPRAGHILQGVTGYWIDGAGTTATAQTHITNAATQGKGILIRNHPRVLDDSGKLTTSEFTAFLDFLKGEQDAGRVKVLNLSQWSIADTGK